MTKETKEVFDVDKLQERIIELMQERIDTLKDINNLLEAKILSWAAKSKDEEFKAYFDITNKRKGKISKCNL
jgi:hypothetical protein